MDDNVAVMYDMVFMDMILTGTTMKKPHNLEDKYGAVFLFILDHYLQYLFMCIDCTISSLVIYFLIRTQVLHHRNILILSYLS